MGSNGDGQPGGFLNPIKQINWARGDNLPGTIGTPAGLSYLFGDFANPVAKALNIGPGSQNASGNNSGSKWSSINPVTGMPDQGAYIVGEGNQRRDLQEVKVDPADLPAFYASEEGMGATGANLLDYGGHGADGRVYSKNGQDLTDTWQRYQRWYNNKTAAIAAHKEYVANAESTPGRDATLFGSSPNISKSILGPGPQDIRKTVLG